VGAQDDSYYPRVVFAFKDGEENALSIPAGGTGVKTGAMVPVGAQKRPISGSFLL
jgi:hypothetical protein